MVPTEREYLFEWVVRSRGGSLAGGSLGAEACVCEQLLEVSLCTCEQERVVYTHYTLHTELDHYVVRVLRNCNEPLRGTWYVYCAIAMNHYVVRGTCTVQLQ